MNGTLNDVLTVARRNIGFIEGQNNDNPYAAVAGHPNNQPWCASFVAAVFSRAGVKMTSTSPYTPTMANGFKSDGRWSTTDGKVGDVIFFIWTVGGTRRIAHVGIVEEVHTDGSYTCIEGNTDAKGGRTGGRVMRQRRRSNIAGFGRPVYVAPVKAPAKKAPAKTNTPGSRTLRRTNPPMTGEDVKHLQRRFIELGNKHLTVNGVYDQPTADVANIFKSNRSIVEPGFGPKSWAALSGR